MRILSDGSVGQPASAVYQPGEPSSASHGPKSFYLLEDYLSNHLSGGGGGSYHTSSNTGQAAQLKAQSHLSLIQTADLPYSKAREFGSQRHVASQRDVTVRQCPSYESR